MAEINKIQILYVDYYSNEVASAVKDIETDLVTVSVPSGKKFLLTGFESEGTTDAVYQVKKGADILFRQRTVITTKGCGKDLTYPLSIAGPSVVKITVTPYKNGGTHFGTITGKVV